MEHTHKYKHTNTDTQTCSVLSFFDVATAAVLPRAASRKCASEDAGEVGRGGRRFVECPRVRCKDVPSSPSTSRGRVTRVRVCVCGCVRSEAQWRPSIRARHMRTLLQTRTPTSRRRKQCEEQHAFRPFSTRPGLLADVPPRTACASTSYSPTCPSTCAQSTDLLPLMAASS